MLAQAYGEFQYDRIDEKERSEIIRNACPGPGACGGMYTANTMATAAEALGMALPVRRLGNTQCICIRYLCILWESAALVSTELPLEI